MPDNDELAMTTELDLEIGGLGTGFSNRGSVRIRIHKTDFLVIGARCELVNNLLIRHKNTERIPTIVHFDGIKEHSGNRRFEIANNAHDHCADFERSDNNLKIVY